MESMPRRVKLSSQAFLQYAPELLISNGLPPCTKPNLVARKIESRLPVRRNHLPSNSSLSP